MIGLKDCVDYFNGEWPEGDHYYIKCDKGNYSFTKDHNDRCVDKLKFNIEAMKLGYTLKEWLPKPYELALKHKDVVTVIGYCPITDMCIYQYENGNLARCHPSHLSPIEHHKIQQYLKKLDMPCTKENIVLVEKMFRVGDVTLD